jgi:2'-5' RNA ligase
MREPDFYRYFLGFRPDPALRGPLADIGVKLGQRVRPELLHLTLCVVSEAPTRNLFLLPRIRAALAGQELHSFPVRLGKVGGGENGAAIRTTGRQDEIQDFYRALVRWLARRGIAPLHRKAGLNPHLTLGYDSCRFDPFRIAVEWLPRELLLIESEVGNGTHNVLCRWPLLAARQGELPFDPLMPLLRIAS